QAIAARGFTVEEMQVVEPMRQRAFVGSASQVADKLRRLADELALDEIVINTWAHDPQVRRHSYALLAREFGLGANSLKT
ncbi:MAG TPA: LLM class flavin-dependent oxidoreductase, partial [Rhizobacter sp.]|nr:LLM class flavin-dependent oxidoreductase [Rhizobacter sp.]